MAINNSIQKSIHDFLLTRNIEVQSVDTDTGKTPLDDEGNIDFKKIDLMTFPYQGPSGKNYGTVILLINSNEIQIANGDRFGKGMEPEDKNDWFGSDNQPGVLEALKSISVRHDFHKFDIMNPSRLKYTKQGIAALEKGLFESFTGNKKYSFTGDPQKARLMIKHSQPIENGIARYRFVESLYIETSEGERFRLPFRKLSGGRAMLEHVKQGGKPYDARGQHIVDIVEQINVLGHFRRANQNRVFEGQAQNIVESAEEHFESLKKNLKKLTTPRGYNEYFESWQPLDITETEVMVEDIKNLFVEQRLDPRIENALPLLKTLSRPVKEAEEFQNWADSMVNDQVDSHDTKEQQEQLKTLLQQPLPVGPEGINASEQLYDLLQDRELSDIINVYANQAGPEANAWDSPAIMQRLQELGVDVSTELPDDNQKIDEAFPLAALAARVVMAAAPAIASHKVADLLDLDQTPDHAVSDDTLERIKYLANRI